jgi:type II secretory pathway component PulC
MLNTAKPPPSPLSLTLTATFTQADPAKSIAIIASQGKTTRQFVAGDEVAPGTTLTRVDKGFVVLMRNGREEMLMLPILADNKATPSQPDLQRAPSITPPPASQSAANNPQQDQNDEALRKQKLMERLKALRDQRTR